MISAKHQIYFQMFEYDLRFYKKNNEGKEYILGIYTYPNDPKQLINLISGFEERWFYLQFNNIELLLNKNFIQLWL